MNSRFFRLPFSERYHSFSHKQEAKKCASKNRQMGMKKQLGQRKQILKGIKIGQKQKKSRNKERRNMH